MDQQSHVGVGLGWLSYWKQARIRCSTGRAEAAGPRSSIRPPFLLTTRCTRCDAFNQLAEARTAAIMLKAEVRMHSVTNVDGERHQVVVGGAGFGGLNVARLSLAWMWTSRWWTGRTNTFSRPCSTRSPPASSRRA